MKDFKYFLESKYFDFRIPHPLLQGVFIICIALFFMMAGGVFKNPYFPWLASGAFLLLYTLFNNGLGIFVKEYTQYIQLSMLTFVALISFLGFMAYFISGKSIFDQELKEAYSSIYLVLILAYFSLLAICFMIRNIADFIKEKDDQMHQ